MVDESYKLKNRKQRKKINVEGQRQGLEEEDIEQNEKSELK